jgi:hypothetical protein
MKVMRGNHARHNYPIPIIRGRRERVGRAAQGVEEAVMMAGGKAVQQFERAKPGAVGKPTKIDPNQLRQTMVDSGTGIIAKSLSSAAASKKSKPKKKKKKSTKHKRSKIDDVLGVKDSY